MISFSNVVGTARFRCWKSAAFCSAIRLSPPPAFCEESVGLRLTFGRALVYASVLKYCALLKLFSSSPTLRPKNTVKNVHPEIVSLYPTTYNSYCDYSCICTSSSWVGSSNSSTVWSPYVHAWIWVNHQWLQLMSAQLRSADLILWCHFW